MKKEKVVMEAYEFDWRTMTESECVAELMKKYQKKKKIEEPLIYKKFIKFRSFST